MTDKAIANRSSVGGTVRASLHNELLLGFATARQLSARLGVPEKDIAGHLQHLEKSMRSKGEKLLVEPAACLGCGFVFRKRDRLTRPGSCPMCRSSHIEAPRFSVKGTTSH